MTRNELIDVLSVIAAATRRTVGETDVEIWGSVIGHLDKDLALEAVAMHIREKPGVWLEPGHVVANARGILRDRAARSPLQLGPKVQEGPVKAAYDAVGALSVDCPACEAPAGEFCVGGKGKPRRMPCPKRIPRQEAS
jgi:hypothetical protein